MRTFLVATILMIMVPRSSESDPAPTTRGNEVIVIEGSPPAPKVKAKPKKRYLPRGEIDNIFLRPAPEYSDAAITSDAWSRAWMLLDIDETGKVRRVKFLKYPGHDLEPLAVKTAFGLQFEPAIASDGQPARSWIAWPIEWPSYWWLISRVGLATGIPDTSHIPCRGEGPLNLDSTHAVYRDCSKPNWSMADTEPWYEPAPQPR